MSISIKKRNGAPSKPELARAKGQGAAMEPETINSTELRAYTRDYMERVKFNREVFIVETFNRPMAVLISIQDFELIQHILKQAGLATTLRGQAVVEIPERVARRKRRARAKREGEIR